MHDEAAAVHLFRVSAGLDSLIPGESEILGQVRAAFDAASPGPLLDRVFRQALQLGKRVRTETAIGESPASVPVRGGRARGSRSSATSTAARVLLVGAGRIGELAAGSLSARGASIAYVANRSPEAAAELAARFGGEPLALDERRGEARRGRRRAHLDRARPGSLIEAARRAVAPPPAALLHRHRRPARRRPGGARARRLLPLRHRRPRGGRRRDARRAAAPRPRSPSGSSVEEAERFREWQASLDVVPAIASLRARAEEIRAAELAKLGDAARGRAPHARVGDGADPEQAAPPADGADEGGGRSTATARPTPTPSGTCSGSTRAVSWAAVLVRIGSRGSRLALTQAELAAARLRRAGHEVAFVPITTAGDRDRKSPFGQIGERGVFVKEIEEALLAGRIDVAVHSAKDMTSTDTDGLAVGAYLERDDPRDALVGADAIRPGMRIGTASVRRRAQLLALEPTISVEPLRGNIDTRLRKAPRARPRRARARRLRPRPARARRRDRRCGCRSRRCCPRPRRARSRSRCAPARRSSSPARRLRRDAPAGRGRARVRRPDRRRLPRAGRRAPRRRACSTALIAAEDGTGSSGAAATDPARARRRSCSRAAARGGRA